MNAAQRGAILTQQLLNYGRKAQLSPKVVDLNEAVRAADRMVSRLLTANIQLNTVTGVGLWQANVDASLLDTATPNIVNNTRDAVLPGGGRITMETGSVRIDQSYVDSREEEVVPGRYVMLAISDTGTGMDDETLSQVFNPFFTTKPIGSGSGLGLSMVFGFMRQSGGAILAYSEVGTGTTLRFYFPAVNQNGNDVDDGSVGGSGAFPGQKPDGKGLRPQDGHLVKPVGRDALIQALREMSEEET